MKMVIVQQLLMKRLVVVDMTTMLNNKAMTIMHKEDLEVIEHNNKDDFESRGHNTVNG